MRYINNRNNEPNELIEYRKTPGAIYDDLGGENKTIIKDSLLDEQGYICAYCMGKINSETSTIEHYISQKRHEDSPYSEKEHKRQSLLYSNMCGVCINTSLHCDKKRGNLPLEILDPHKPSCEKLITYNLEGEIVPTGSQFDKVIKDIETLGLNCTKLKKNRKAAWDEVWERFKNEHDKNKWSKKLFLEFSQRYHNKILRRGNIYKFHAFCNFIAWHFEHYANNYKHF